QLRPAVLGSLKPCRLFRCMGQGPLAEMPSPVTMKHVSYPRLSSPGGNHIMKSGCLLIGGILTSLAFTSRAVQAKPRREEPLVEKVRKAIEGGKRYLRTQQQRNGSWEAYHKVALFDGGCTSLALLALLNAGVSPKDGTIRRGLGDLRKIEPRHTCVVALQTRVYVEAGKTTDSERIQRNVDWLIKTAVTDGDKLLGWTYGTTGRSFPDNSNSQYAILGLHAGKMAGARIDP